MPFSSNASVLLLLHLIYQLHLRGPFYEVVQFIALALSRQVRAGAAQNNRFKAS